MQITEQGKSHSEQVGPGLTSSVNLTELQSLASSSSCRVKELNISSTHRKTLRLAVCRWTSLSTLYFKEPNTHFRVEIKPQIISVVVLSKEQWAARSFIHLTEEKTRHGLTCIWEFIVFSALSITAKLWEIGWVELIISNISISYCFEEKTSILMEF